MKKKTLIAYDSVVYPICSPSFVRMSIYYYFEVCNFTQNVLEKLLIYLFCLFTREKTHLKESFFCMCAVANVYRTSERKKNHTARGNGISLLECSNAYVIDVSADDKFFLECSCVCLYRTRVCSADRVIHQYTFACRYVYVCVFVVNSQKNPTELFYAKCLFVCFLFSA